MNIVEIPRVLLTSLRLRKPLSWVKAYLRLAKPQVPHSVAGSWWLLHGPALLLLLSEVQGLGNPGRRWRFAPAFHSFSRGGPACIPHHDQPYWTLEVNVRGQGSTSKPTPQESGSCGGGSTWRLAMDTSLSIFKTLSWLAAGVLCS